MSPSHYKCFIYYLLVIFIYVEPPHIVVGNPKSLQRLVDIGRLRLNAVSYVVIDEVDASLMSPDTRAELHKLLSRHLSNTYQSGDVGIYHASIANLAYTN
jgi:hypothetical protein